MSSELIIRLETKEDYYKAEHMVMRAFWNLHGPGCNEHLLVHKIRQSEDFIPELTYVAELDGEIVGAIYYTKAKVVNGDTVHDIITFGPLAVEPTLQNGEIGKKLLEKTMGLAKEMEYSGIAIYGEPDYYPKLGFLTCDNFQITDPNGENYGPLMGYRLNDSWDQVHGKLYESKMFEECEDPEELAEFNKQFPYYEPLSLKCQWVHKEKIGRICEIQKNMFIIKYFELELPAKIKGSFHENLDFEMPLVGDYVTFLYNPTGESTILSVCERSYQ